MLIFDQAQFIKMASLRQNPTIRIIIPIFFVYETIYGFERFYLSIFIKLYLIKRLINLFIQIYEELPTHRVKRSANGEYETEQIRPRIIKLDNHFTDDIEHQEGHDYHEVEEHEIDEETGEVNFF